MDKLTIVEYNNVNEFADSYNSFRERIINWLYFNVNDGITDNDRDNWSEEIYQIVCNQLVFQAIPIHDNWFWKRECDHFISIVHPLNLLEEVYDEELHRKVVNKIPLLTSECIIVMLRNRIRAPVIVSELCAHVSYGIVTVNKESTIKMNAIFNSTIDSLIRRGSFFTVSVLIENNMILESICADLRCDVKYRYWLIGLENCVQNNRQTDIVKARDLLVLLLQIGNSEHYNNILTLINELIGNHLEPRKQLQMLYNSSEIVV